MSGDISPVYTYHLFRQFLQTHLADEIWCLHLTSIKNAELLSCHYQNSWERLSTKRHFNKYLVTNIYLTDSYNIHINRIFMTNESVASIASSKSKTRKTSVVGFMASWICHRILANSSNHCQPCKPALMCIPCFYLSIGPCPPRKKTKKKLKWGLWTWTLIWLATFTCDRVVNDIHWMLELELEGYKMD